jgi:hypothetical protein
VATDLDQLHDVWLEILVKRDQLVRSGAFDVRGMGTSGGNYGNLRIAQQNFSTGLHQSEVTWLMTARLKLATIAVNPSDDTAAIRQGLVELAATVLGWIEEIDSE